MRPAPETREEWLMIAAEKLMPWLVKAGVPVLKKFRVSVGFPRASKKAIGQCWHPKHSKDAASEIFISPKLDTKADVISTLLHEMIHAGVGTEAGHKGEFRRAALALGFTPPMTSTPLGVQLQERVNALASELPDFPHKAMSFSDMEGPKTQTTRMLLCQCECGCKVRMTKTWLDKVGPPSCGCGRGLMKHDE